ncbi:MAG: hypothetical protein ACJ8GK_04010 [Luteimonas sp.]
MTRNDPWLLATFLALAAPSAFAGQPPQRDAPPAAAATPSPSHAQSPIGRALAQLLQQASANPDRQPAAHPAAPSSSAIAASGDAGVPGPGAQQLDADAAAIEASAEQIAVH